MKIDYGIPEDESKGVAISIVPESDFEATIISHVANTLVQSLRNGVRIKLEPSDDPGVKFQANPALAGTEFDFEPVDHDEHEGMYDEDGFMDFDKEDEREAALA